MVLAANTGVNVAPLFSPRAPAPTRTQLPGPSAALHLLYPGPPPRAGCMRPSGPSVQGSQRWLLYEDSSPGCVSAGFAGRAQESAPRPLGHTSEKDLRASEELVSRESLDEHICLLQKREGHCGQVHR